MLSVSAGNIFGLLQGGSKRDLIRAELRRLDDADLGAFVLYNVLAESKPDIVVDCVNTSTGIAYGDIFRSAEEVLTRARGRETIREAATERLLDALYMPRLIRHIQVMYRGMIDAGTRVYIKVGTTGTGGMGLNIPYTHSEEGPSRVLLSKSAHGRRPVDAPLPDGPHPRRADHQGDQAGGGDRLEADGLRPHRPRRQAPPR